MSGFTIVATDRLSELVKRFVIKAPAIAAHAQPGQFVMLRLDETGERIPLTIAESDRANGTITIIVQELGKTTTVLGQRGAGMSIPDILGPLGHPTPVNKVGTVVAMGGGVGVAEVYPVARAYRDAGNRVVGIIGARTKNLIILENEMRSVCDELLVATDDGSYGHHGLVTVLLEETMKKQPINLVYAIGPVPMMRAVAETTRASAIETIVSLNPIMVDGTGMCGACRVTVNGKTQFACVDGPEFNGHQVDWKELVSRLSMFKEHEQRSLHQHRAGCRYNI